MFKFIEKWLSKQSQKLKMAYRKITGCFRGYLIGEKQW